MFRQARGQILMLGVLVLAAVFAQGLWLLRRLLRPIGSIAQGTERIAASD
jgi:cytochrome oxidase assembly protein ShyY1